MTIHDPVFGELTLGFSGWEGKACAPGLGRRKTVPLKVNTIPPGSEPNETHREIFLEFVEELNNGLRGRLEVAVYKDFRLLAKKRRLARDFDASQVTEPEQVWKFLRTPRIGVHGRHGLYWILSVRWRAQWSRDPSISIIYCKGGALTNLDLLEKNKTLEDVKVT